jgi:hypothetical protein
MFDWIGALRRRRAVELAERKALAFDMADHARRLEHSRGVDDAADDASRIDGGRGDPTGVDGLEVETLELPAVSLEVPPGDAILPADHRRVFAQRRGQPGRDRWQAVRFQGDEDGITSPDDRPVIGALRPHGVVVAGLDHPQPVFPHRGQMGTACHQHDVLPGPGQSATEEAANRPGAKDGQPHAGDITW